MPTFPSSLTSHNKKLMALLVAATLAGCGGGGGDSPSPAPAPAPPTQPTPPTEPTPPTSPVVSDVSPSYTGGGAVNSTQYSGTGVGIWHKKNIANEAQDVRVDIGGLVNKEVTVIFSNGTNLEQNMQAVAMTSQVSPTPVRSSLTGARQNYEAPAAVTEFNRSGWTNLLKATRSQFGTRVTSDITRQADLVAGTTTRVFNHHDGVARNTTLRKQVTTTDGTAVNFWVEDGQFDLTKVTQTSVDQLATALSKQGGIYDMLKDIGGPLWGPHPYVELVDGAGQSVDIVIMNFNNDGQPYGEIGYYYAMNAFKKAYAPKSNESISLYLDSETLALGGAKGVQAIKSSVSHELMHMSNFYRRGVLIGPEYQYDTWVEEMTAMMMEDVSGLAIDPTYNATRDMRFPDYLTYGGYNCPLTRFTGFGATCESYALNGAFGGFMLRQMGVRFYKELLRANYTSSEMALDMTVQAHRPSSSLGNEMRKFAVAAIPALPSSTAPAGFNFPALNDSGYSIPAINPVQYKTGRTLPTTAPATLTAYGNFPIVRKGVTGRFTQTYKVPAGTTLSVVVN
jgi:hypothetical protein